MQIVSGIVFGLVACVIGLTAAEAEPMRLSCNGAMRLQNANGETREPRTFLFVIDLAARRVTVDLFGTADITSKADEDIIVFMANRGSLDKISSGLVNRFTGTAWFHAIVPDAGLYKFEGRCVPARRLF